MPLYPAYLRPWMVRWVRLSIFPLLLLLIAPPTIVAQDVQPDNIVAVVNAEPITRKTLADAAVARYGVDVLDNMLNRHLILQECSKTGIEVTAEDVNAEIQHTAEKFDLSLESYLQMLQEERDIAPDQYSREIVWPMLCLRRLVADQVQVTDEEFNRAFLARYGEAVKCRMIMVGNQEKAQSAHAEAVAAPEKFGQLAKRISEDETSASVGGLIPPIRKYTGDSRLEDAAFALPNDAVSPILQLGDQWVILQAIRRIPATSPRPESMPAVKAQIVDRIRDEKMRGAATDLFTRLQTDAKVVKVLGDAEAAKRYPGIAAIVNGQQISISSVAAECIKRHGKDVLEGEINRKLLVQALRKASKDVSEQEVAAEVQNAAIRFGFIRSDGSADLQAWIDSVTSDGNTTEEIYIQDAVWPSVALKKLVEDSVVITDEDMKNGFEAAYGPRVEVLAIVLSDQRTAQKIWEMARDNPTDQFFSQLAAQYSVEPVSASNEGKVPPIRKHSGQPLVEREAFALKPGGLSGIIATGDRYIILRCQGFTEPIVHEISEVRDELVRDIQDRKMSSAMSEMFDGLKKSAEIDNFFEVARQAPKVAARPQTPGARPQAPVQQ